MVISWALSPNSQDSNRVRVGLALFFLHEDPCSFFSFFSPYFFVMSTSFCFFLLPNVKIGMWEFLPYNMEQVSTNNLGEPEIFLNYNYHTQNGLTFISYHLSCHSNPSLDRNILNGHWFYKTPSERDVYVVHQLYGLHST